MAEHYSKEEDKELNAELKKFKNMAKRLILNDYYDSVRITDLQYSILKQITNAESHYDVNAYLWNSGMIDRTLKDISDMLKQARRQK